MAKAKDLVIVESPAKAKTIEKYLGSGYKVKASMGHVRDLPKSKMGVDIEHGFEPEYIPVKDKKELIAELKKGLDIALVTDAGTPAISDPGEVLVRECIAEGIPVTSLPGACEPNWLQGISRISSPLSW